MVGLQSPLVPWTAASRKLPSGIYTEIVRPHRLIFTFNWEHETQKMLVNLTFRPVGNGTEMTLVQTGFDNAERRDNHDEGWSGSFDKLADMLSNS